MKIFCYRFLVFALALDCFGHPNDNGNMATHVKVRKFERNTNAEFEFVTLNTKLETPYAEIPTQSSFVWNIDSPDMFFGDGCNVQLTVDLIDYQQETSVTLCLFQGNISFIDNLMVPNQKLEILGNMYDPIMYYKKLSPITGFVMGEFNSLLHGFLLDQNFYGTVRLFDPLPHHHILFNIEPFRNLDLYNPAIDKTKREPGLNAALFEYVRHEADIGGHAEKAPSGNTDKKTQDNLNSGIPDIASKVKLKVGYTTSNMFDVRKDGSILCELCIWIQPNFAEKFGLRGGVKYGVGEILNLFTFIQFVFQGIDFNEDSFADEVNLVVKELIVSDEIHIDKKVEPNSTADTAKPVEETKATSEKYLSEGDSGTKIEKVKRQADEKEKSKKKDSGYDEPELEEPYSQEAKHVKPREAYENLRGQLVTRFMGKRCCAILGYIYHNIVPKLSYSTQRGLCSDYHNVGIISGFIHAHKVGKFDIYRSTMHVLGHLFGAKEDDISNQLCEREAAETPQIFNPSLMELYHKIDIGIRPNAMRFSLCAKLDITSFLTSENAHCLRSTVQVKPKCGNGVLEPGEDCDCGLPWQCHIDQPLCCGESDTFVGCRKIGARKYRMDSHCHRPFIW